MSSTPPPSASRAPESPDRPKAPPPPGLAGGPSVTDAPGFGPDQPDEGYAIRIDREGVWYYHGSPIGRIALARLFSTVLRRDEAGDYWLITPAERGRILVEDAPFVAISVDFQGEGPTGDNRQRLTFRTNLDHVVTAGPDHPIRIQQNPATGEPRPYVLVRGSGEKGRLEARISRSVFYELVARGEFMTEGGKAVLGLWSDGVFFQLGDLPA
jgi:hypothetical protein